MIIVNTRGFRNNNPLNIRHGQSHWLHKAKIQTDPAFVVFDEMKWGYRAAWKLMDSYRLRLTSEGKPFNIHNIIRRWAPPNENDTSAYIQRVVRITGISEFQQLSEPGKRGDQLVKVLKGMTIVENGIKEEQVPMNAIRDGYRLAFPYGWIENEASLFTNFQEGSL